MAGPAAGIRCTPQQELVLLAKAGPLGAARITLRLSDIAGGWRLAGLAERREPVELEAIGPR